MNNSHTDRNSNIFRFDGFDVGVAFGIFGIEGQQILNVVGFQARRRFPHRGLLRPKPNYEKLIHVISLPTN